MRPRWRDAPVAFGGLAAQRGKSLRSKSQRGTSQTGKSQTGQSRAGNSRASRNKSDRGSVDESATFAAYNIWFQRPGTPSYMRIRCPSCSATYEVSDTLLDPPRTVRCARCSHDWVATPLKEVTSTATPSAAEEDRVPAPVRAEEPAPATSETVHGAELTLGDTPLSAIERLSAPSDLSPRTRGRDHLLTAAWAASFAILAGLGVAGYTQRDALMRHWPASKRVYATLGLIPMDLKADDRKEAEAPKEPAEHGAAHTPSR
jgi:predicted Zn finger-like uncharacterized protein